MAKTAALGSRLGSRTLRPTKIGSKAHFGVDEVRKRVLLIAASILAVRKLARFDGGKRVPATVGAIGDAVGWAGEIMKAINERWPLRS